MNRRYELLQDFFLAYFHPDWQLDAETRLDVVKDFVRTADPILIAGVLVDLRGLLAEPASATEMYDTITREYSLHYDPASDELTMRAWLDLLLEDIETCADNI